MHFTLIDRVLEQSETRIVAIKQVSNAEEYLQDHFPTFPVLPGVMMVEAMVQAARLLLPDADLPWVLAEARALKYGAFVRPGAVLRVEIDLAGAPTDERAEFKAKALLLEPGADPASAPTACAGRLALRPARPAA